MLSWVFGLKAVEAAAPHEPDSAVNKKKKKKRKKNNKSVESSVMTEIVESKLVDAPVVDSESDSDSDAIVGFIETKSAYKEAYNMGISAAVLMEAKNNSSNFDPIKLIIEDVQELATNRGINSHNEEAIRDCVMKMFDNSLNYNNSEDVLQQLLQNKSTSPKNVATREAPFAPSISSEKIQIKSNVQVEVTHPVIHTNSHVKVKSSKPITKNLNVLEEIVSNHAPVEAVTLIMTKLGDDNDKNELFACKAVELLLHRILMNKAGVATDITPFMALITFLLQYKGESNQYILEVMGNSLEKIIKDVNDYSSHTLEGTIDIVCSRIVSMLKSSYEELKARRSQTMPDLHLKARLEKSDQDLSSVISELQKMTTIETPDVRMLMVNADLETDKLLLSIESLEIFHATKAAYTVPSRVTTSLPSTSNCVKQIESQIFASLGESVESVNQKLSRQSGIKNQINLISRESDDQLRPIEGEIEKINHSINNFAAEKEMLLKKIHSIDIEMNDARNRRTTLDGACSDIIAGREKQLEQLYSHDADYLKISKLSNFGTCIKNNLASLESNIGTYLRNDPTSVALATALSSTAEYNRVQILQNSIVPYLESQVGIIEFMSRRIYLTKDKIEYTREEINEYIKLKLPLQVKENEEIIATLDENILEDINSLQEIQNIVIDHVYTWSEAMQSSKGIAAKGMAHLLPNNQLSSFRGCLQRIIAAFGEAKVECIPDFYALLNN